MKKLLIMRKKIFDYCSYVRSLYVDYLKEPYKLKIVM